MNIKRTSESKITIKGSFFLGQLEKDLFKDDFIIRFKFTPSLAAILKNCKIMSVVQDNIIENLFIARFVGTGTQFFLKETHLKLYPKQDNPIKEKVSRFYLIRKRLSLD
jgi:hypothetical protein